MENSVKEKPDSKFSLLHDIPNIEITAITVIEQNSPFTGKSIIETELKKQIWGYNTGPQTRGIQ